MTTSPLRQQRIAWLSALFAALALAVAAAPAAADEAQSLYDPSTVFAIAITLPQEKVEALEDEPHEYVTGATVTLATTDGTPSGIGPASSSHKAEIKLKSQEAGSFEELDGKAAFKLKFKKAEALLGLRKLTLNNMVQDPSMIHETLAYTAFRAAGVPAPRSGYAYVTLNGTPYGLYFDVETLDKVALERIFGATFQEPPQHMYETNYGNDLYPGEASVFEVDEGEEADVSDLETLISAVGASSPAALIDRVNAFADFGELTRMWSTEKYIGHWDGYAGREVETGPNPYRPNNYYLYSDPLGRFQMLPWGTDQTWEDKLPFESQDGHLFDLCLEDKACFQLFRQGVENALTTVGGLDLDSFAAETADLLAPWQQPAYDPRRPYSLSQVKAAVADTRDFIADRPAEAAAWLAAHPAPKPESPPVTVPLPPGDPPETPGTRLFVGRAGLTSHDLRTRLRILAKGSATLTVLVPTEHGLRRACSDQIEADAGFLTLRCTLPVWLPRRAARQPLRLTLKTEFQPADGADAELVTRHFRLPRA